MLSPAGVRVSVKGGLSEGFPSSSVRSFCSSLFSCSCLFQSCLSHITLAYNETEIPITFLNRTELLCCTETSLWMNDTLLLLITAHDGDAGDPSLTPQFPILSPQTTVDDTTPLFLCAVLHYSLHTSAQQHWVTLMQDERYLYREVCFVMERLHWK